VLELRFLVQGDSPQVDNDLIVDNSHDYGRVTMPQRVSDLIGA
jgi:hypothetical protein